jgi:MSHA biogenesis protein MshP
MCPDQIRKIGMPPSAIDAQGGFSIVSAIFLLVVLSSLGAIMLTFSSVQQTTSAQDLEGAKAYQAARAGIEFGLYQILTPSGVAGCGSTTTLAWGGTLAGFTNTVDYGCSPVYTEGSTTFTIYTITSTAKSPNAAGSSKYIERQLQATVSQGG